MISLRPGLLLLLVGLLFYGCTEEEYDELSLPDEYRFTQDVFLKNLNEPVELEVLPDGSIIYVERKGGIRWYDPQNRRMILEDSIGVFFGFEDGLMGMALDPNFEENNWIYLYYAPPGDEPKQHLSRFVWTDQGLTDEKVVLVVPTQRDKCCHTGGSIEFGPDGLLYLSTGDDTNPFESKGYAPIDDRPGRAPFDARRTSSNTNDLRGKILRIKPEDDGTYSIPSGNLFEDDDPLTRPEIFVMGCRNPYRITVDQKRGWLFWGDVGPDAGENDSIRGPRGHDEMNVAITPGYYGWPLFIGDNKQYADWDFDQNVSNGYFEPTKPINDSRFNTGLKKLPPARPAMIYYPYAVSQEFPMLTNGGRTAMTGPVFYSESGFDKRRSFPDFFNERLFVYDWMRDWIYTIKVDSSGTPSDFVPFTPSSTYSNIIDMDFGPDGALYMIEYGSAWFSQNEDARLSRISFDRTNRVPKMVVEQSVNAGSAPLLVKFDASGSIDHDGDELSFVWKIGDDEYKGSTLEYEFTEKGVYWPRLTLTDGKGHTLIEQFKVEVGNDAPVVDIALAGNQSFYWPGRQIAYEVSVTDPQDGKIGNGILNRDVQFDIIYVEGHDQAQILGHQMPVVSGEALIKKSDCYACHKIDGKSVGPSFVEVANRYQSRDDIKETLAAKIIKGGSGTWGDHSMSAHPDFTPDEAMDMVNFILSLNKKKDTYPLKGYYTVTEPDLDKSLLFSAQYTDKGAAGLSPILDRFNTTLQPHIIAPGTAPKSKFVETSRELALRRTFNLGWIAWDELDLTNVKSISIHGQPKLDAVSITARIESEEGPEIGQIIIKDEAENWDTYELVIDKPTSKTAFYLVFNGEIDKNLMFIKELKFNISDQ